MSETGGCPDCGDSPLSTTGNVTGILTFAYAILASVVLFLAVIGTADNELQQLETSQEQTSRHIETLYRYFADLDGVAHPDLAAMREPIAVALDNWRRTARSLDVKIAEYRSIRSKVGRGLRWWFQQNDIKAAVAMLRTEKDDLSALLLTHLSMRLTTQDHQLRVLERLTMDVLRKGRT